jgi:hypothetical protein
MSARMAPTLAKSRAMRAGSIANLPEILAPAQKLGIDCTDLVESFA